MDEAMFATGNTGKDSHRFALVTGAKNRYLIRREGTELVRSGKIFIRHLDVTELAGGIDVCFH